MAFGASLISGFLLLGIIVEGSNIPSVANTRLDAPAYSAFDDASWAIVSPTVSTVLGEAQKTTYDAFIKECQIHSQNQSKSCSQNESFRLTMNAEQPVSMKNFTKLGFKKIRAPKEIFTLIEDFWKKNRNTKPNIEWDHVNPYHNNWQAPTSMLHVQNEEFEGGGRSLAASIEESSRSVLEEWTGQKLTGSSVYGIRIYHNNSILAPHVDRLPLVSSAIINVDQDVDEDWILEVYGHDGRAHNVTMEPGDMVLYESHSVIHGRPFPLRGKFFANIFIHFEALGDIHSRDKIPEPGSLPPYIIEGSQWESKYREANPNGWTLLSDITGAMRRGDLVTLKYIAQRDPSRMTASYEPRAGWQPIHMATKSGYIHILKFLIEELNIDVNTPFFIPYGKTPYSLAMDVFSGNKSHPTVEYLYERGGRPYLEIYGCRGL